MQYSSFRPAGFAFIGLHCLLAVAEAGTSYESVSSTVDEGSIIKTVSGVSEIQCVLKCRRDATCKRSLYDTEKETATCHFLKDEDSIYENDQDGISGTLHSEIGITIHRLD